MSEELPYMGSTQASTSPPILVPVIRDSKLLLSKIWFSSPVLLELFHLKYWNSDYFITSTESYITNPTRQIGRLQYTTLYPTRILTRWPGCRRSFFEYLLSSLALSSIPFIILDVG